MADEDAVLFDEGSAERIAKTVRTFETNPARLANRGYGDSMLQPNVQTVRCTSTTPTTGHVNGGVAVSLYPGKIQTGVFGNYSDVGDCWLIGINGDAPSVDNFASAKASAVNEDDGLPVLIVGMAVLPDVCCENGLGIPLSQCCGGIGDPPPVHCCMVQIFRDCFTNDLYQDVHSGPSVTASACNDDERFGPSISQSTFSIGGLIPLGGGLYLRLQYDGQNVGDLSVCPWFPWTIAELAAMVPPCSGTVPPPPVPGPDPVPVPVSNTCPPGWRPRPDGLGGCCCVGWQWYGNQWVCPSDCSDVIGGIRVGTSSGGGGCVGCGSGGVLSPMSAGGGKGGCGCGTGDGSCACSGTLGKPIGDGITLGGSHLEPVWPQQIAGLDAAPVAQAPVYMTSTGSLAQLTPVANKFVAFDGSGNITTTTGGAGSLGTQSPTISADHNDYNPGSCSFLRATVSGGNRTLTGIAIGQSENQMLVICNVGSSNNLILTTEDAASAAANRFNFGNPSVDQTITPSSTITLYYDGTSQRWRKI